MWDAVKALKFFKTLKDCLILLKRNNYPRELSRKVVLRIGYCKLIMTRLEFLVKQLSLWFLFKICFNSNGKKEYIICKCTEKEKVKFSGF